MYTNISFAEFQQIFSNEQDCRDFLFKRRWPHGYKCPKCPCKKYSYISSRGLYQCCRCRYQCSLTVDTIFEKSRTPLLKWFWMIFFIANQKNGCAALELKRFLAISYKTALYMSHKIRTAMVARDARYKLAGLVEMDDSYFGAKKYPGKRGRGSENKATVIVGVQLSEDELPQFTTMIQVENLTEKNVKQTVKEHVVEKSTIKTDGYSSYNVLKKYNYVHTPIVIADPKQASKLLRWVHVMIANVKGNIRGTHHGVSKKHLQRYLAEFSYRFNRRFSMEQIFDRLLTACIVAQPIAVAELST